MPSLRHIAVYVEEPKPGRFVWVLVELKGHDWHRLDVCDSPVASYQTAMAQGLLALQGRVENLDVGPREAGAPNQQSDANARRPIAKRAAPAVEPESGKPYFGFGPVK